MDAVERDERAWSYLCCSLLGRELAEFGALWHGVSWGVHRVIGSAPWEEGDHWTDELPAVDELEPRVSIVGSDAVVRFFRFTGLGERRVVEHVDRYAADGTLQVQRRTVATGGAGFVF
jgi:hypothetical protein